MRKHGGIPSRRDKHVTLAAISPPGVARGRFVGGQQSGLAGCKPPPLFKRGASSCSSQGRRQGEPWGASPRPSAPTYLPTSAWNKHWGGKRRGHLYVHGAQQDSERTPNKIIADRAKGLLVLTGLVSGDARGEVVRSKIDSIALKEFVFAPDEEIFMDATGTSLPSPGQAWSTHTHFVDGAQCHPTGGEAFIRRIQAVPMMVMIGRATTLK